MVKNEYARTRSCMHVLVRGYMCIHVMGEDARW